MFSKFSLMHKILLPLLLLGVASLFTACGPENFSEDEIKTEQKPHNIDVSLGSFVYYDNNGNSGYDPAEDTALSGVTITITDIDGVSESATSNTNGIWVLENVQPGSYLISLSLTGYETILDDIDVTLVDAENVGNAFFDVDPVQMQESEMEITLLSNTLTSGDSPANGVNGVSASYDISADTDIVANYSQTVVSASLSMSCTSLVGTGGANSGVSGTVSNSNVSTLTLPEANINLCLDGSDADALADGMDTNAYTYATMTVAATWITPIHGTSRSHSSTLAFNVVD